MSEQVPSDSLSIEGLRLGEWQPLHQAEIRIRERLMTTNPEFVLRNWDCKYINMRVDMRTGNVVMTPGNIHE